MRHLQPTQRAAEGRQAEPDPGARLPAGLALGERVIGMLSDVLPQLDHGIGAEPALPSQVGQWGGPASSGPKPPPAANRRGAHANDGRDLTHRPSGIEGGEGTFTEVAGGLRVAHAPA